MTSWYDFQSTTQDYLERRHGDRVLHEPLLDDGTRPDHVVVRRFGGIASVYDSKMKQRLTASDVSKLVRDRDALGAGSATMVVANYTEIPDAIALQLEDEGIEIAWHEDLADVASDAAKVVVGAGATSLAAAYAFGYDRPDGTRVLNGDAAMGGAIFGLLLTAFLID